MGVLLASVSVYHVCVPAALGGQESETIHLELELQFVSDYLAGYWESNLSPLKEKPVCLATKLYLQPILIPR